MSLNRHLQRPSDCPGPLFVATNNAGEVKLPDGERFLLTLTDVGAKKLLNYQGPLAGDKQQPHDFAIRAAGNRTYKSAKKSGAAWAEAWMAEHPQAYAKFSVQALLVAQKVSHYGAKAIAEYIRHHERFVGGRDFKLPNNVIAYMARRFMREHPEHASFFKTTSRGGAQ